MFSTHILTRRMTLASSRLTTLFAFFNSHPHKEDDAQQKSAYDIAKVFNSHPHKEDDLRSCPNVGDTFLFNSHPHKEDDQLCFKLITGSYFSTHILTRRMTAILNKNTLSKTARIIPFEYNTLKIYIFSNSYLLFFWKNTPFSGANLPKDFCALIIRTKISKYP